MFKLDNPFNVAFFIASLSLLALFLLTFVVALVQKKRSRTRLHVLLLILYFVLIVLIAFISAAFVIVRFPSRFITAVNDGGALVLIIMEKTVFSIGGLGSIVGRIFDLGLISLIVPCCLLVLALINYILLLVKTNRRKASERVIVDAADDEVAEAESGEIAEPAKTLNAAAARTLNAGTVKRVPAQEITEVKSILTKIDKLVTEADTTLNANVSEPKAYGGNVGSELERAIKEGLEIVTEPLAHVEDLSGEGDEDGYEDYEDEVGGEDSEFEEENGEYEEIDEENGEVEEDYDEYDEERYIDEVFLREDGEDVEGGYSEITLDREEMEAQRDFAAPQDEVWAYDAEQLESAESPEFSYDEKVPIETEFEEAHEPLRREDYRDLILAARVRTIIRRPPIKSILEPRVKESEAVKPVVEQKPKAVSKPKAASKPKAKAKSTTAAKTAAKPTAVKADKSKANAANDTRVKVEAAKTGVTPQVNEARVMATAQANDLPITKKYIILNRQNAANVFGEYLKNKREDGQSEMASTLNTIILK